MLLSNPNPSVFGDCITADCFFEALRKGKVILWLQRDIFATLKWKILLVQRLFVLVLILLSSTRKWVRRNQVMNYELFETESKQCDFEDQESFKSKRVQTFKKWFGAMFLVSWLFLVCCRNFPIVISKGKRGGRWFCWKLELITSCMGSNFKV